MAAGFVPVFEDESGAIALGDEWVIGWAVDDDGDVTPLTAGGPQAEAVGHLRPSGHVEIYGVGVFATMGEARVAWLDRE